MQMNAAATLVTQMLPVSTHQAHLLAPVRQVLAATGVTAVT